MVSGMRLRTGHRRRRPRNGHAVHRRLSRWFEPLEERTLLSVGGLPSEDLYDAASAIISPTWFEDFSDSLAPLHVNPATLTTDDAGKPSKETDFLSIDGDEASQYDWIVRFDTQSLEEISSVAETTSLLAGGGIEFQVQRGLGLVGQALVRSYDASIEMVGNWLGSNDAISSYELDVVRQYQLTPNDQNAWRLWGLNNTGQTGGTADADIDAAEAWEISTGSSDIVVGVIDTGIDYTHPDLAANIWTNQIGRAHV